jgi:hypothetical protein
MIAGFVGQLLAHVDWSSVVIFSGAILAVTCYLVLQKVRERELRGKLAALESRLAEQMEKQAGAAVATALTADGRSRDALREAQGIQQRVDEVERRIPSLQEKLEHFRLTLAGIFRNELGAVLSSFDTSVSAVLEHMKADLHMGVARIETIEEMVRNRQQAGRTLLGTGEANLLAEASDDAVDETGAEAVEGQPATAGSATPAGADADVSDLLGQIDVDDASDERSEAA